MRRLFDPVAEDMAFICENGALAVWNEKVLYQDNFEPELTREIVEAIDAREGAEFSCATREFYYIKPKTQHYLDLMTKVVKTTSRVVESFDEITEPCMKLAVYERAGVQEDSIRYWRSRFSDRCTVVTSGMEWVDFIPFGTNKARGLKEYQKLLGIRPEECMVCLLYTSSIIYISHKMEEILRISDDVTVMRDGKWIATKPAKDLSLIHISGFRRGTERRPYGFCSLETEKRGRTLLDFSMVRRTSGMAY